MISLRVLIVDDSPAMRAYVKRTLQMAGLPVSSVYEAGNGQEALEVVARENKPENKLSLIFTDINMPVMNGEELVTKLQAEESSKAIPILVISTDSTQKRVFRLRELGARGYIAKPCAPEMIRLKVEQVVGD